MKLFDVTVPISKDMIVYPGDPGVEVEQVSRIGSKNSYNLTRYSFGSHTGTHIDPPFHFIADGVTVDRLPLEILLGRTRIVEITSPRIDEESLDEFDFSDDMRVLFKTRNSYLWSQPAFVEDYVYITPGAARRLVSQGIKLVGIDYLSVEKFGSDDFETHLTLLGEGAVIIEGLDLREIEAGDYEMICLPLRISEGDGAPARVVLRQMSV
jgi:arylformamidase